MFRASSETTVATFVCIATVKPSRSHMARAACRASTMSASVRIGIVARSGTLGDGGRVAFPAGARGAGGPQLGWAPSRDPSRRMQSRRRPGSAIRALAARSSSRARRGPSAGVSEESRRPSRAAPDSIIALPAVSLM